MAVRKRVGWIFTRTSALGTQCRATLRGGSDCDEEACLGGPESMWRWKDIRPHLSVQGLCSNKFPTVFKRGVWMRSRRGRLHITGPPAPWAARAQRRSWRPEPSRRRARRPWRARSGISALRWDEVRVRLCARRLCRAAYLGTARLDRRPLQSLVAGHPQQSHQSCVIACMALSTNARLLEDWRALEFAFDALQADREIVQEAPSDPSATPRPRSVASFFAHVCVCVCA